MNYRLFSHGDVSYKFNGKNENVVLEFCIYVFNNKCLALENISQKKVGDFRKSFLTNCDKAEICGFRKLDQDTNHYQAGCPAFLVKIRRYKFASGRLPAFLLDVLLERRTRYIYTFDSDSISVRHQI